MVASAYIKVQIVREQTQAPSDQKPYSYELGTKYYEYHNLTATPTLINQMDWTMVNNKIYGVTGLTAQTFWNYYGGNANTYDVTVTSTKNNQTVTIGSGSANADKTFSITKEGISCETTLGSGATQTSNIKFTVDNKVHTQNYYDNFKNEKR